MKENRPIVKKGCFSGIFTGNLSTTRSVHSPSKYIEIVGGCMNLRTKPAGVTALLQSIDPLARL